MIRKAFRKTRSGRYQLRISPAERELLASVPGQIRALVSERDPATVRLFPPAYTDDPEAESVYRELVDDELLGHHLRCLEVLESTLDASDLDRDQMESWLGALNDARLVLGTGLDITEDMKPPANDDPRLPGLALYDYLTWLQGQVVSQLDG